MKTPLRTFLLVTVLAFTALSAGRAVSATGSCRVTCRNNTNQAVGPYSWTSTYSQCCFGAPPRTPNPCPPGYNVSYSEDTFTYSDGHTVHCPA
jgi:hypothetical protein